MGVRRRIRLNSLALWSALVLGAWLLGQSQMQFLSMAAFMTVALMVMTLLLESQFATPLELLKRQSLNVATGNNRQTEYLQRTDEIGTTLRTVNQIGLMFRWLVDDVNQQALNVQQACNEIEQGNSYLHGQTEQLAVNVAQTSASMEQITARVQSSADTAQKPVCWPAKPARRPCAGAVHGSDRLHHGVHYGQLSPHCRHRRRD
jgi:aerotaxis receptor